MSFGQDFAIIKVMSKTKKGSKGPGFDVWSKRPGTTNGGSGPIVKKITKKRERSLKRKEIHKILKEN